MMVADQNIPALHGLGMAVALSGSPHQNLSPLRRATKYVGSRIHRVPKDLQHGVVGPPPAIRFGSQRVLGVGPAASVLPAPSRGRPGAHFQALGICGTRGGSLRRYARRDRFQSGPVHSSSILGVKRNAVHRVEPWRPLQPTLAVEGDLLIGERFMLQWLG